jgi:hypothetical protein
MGQNGTWGVGSFVKIGHTILLVFLQCFCFQKHFSQIFLTKIFLLERDLP